METEAHWGQVAHPKLHLKRKVLSFLFLLIPKLYGLPTRPPPSQDVLFLSQDYNPGLPTPSLVDVQRQSMLLLGTLRAGWRLTENTGKPADFELWTLGVTHPLWDGEIALPKSPRGRGRAGRRPSRARGCFLPAQPGLKTVLACFFRVQPQAGVGHLLSPKGPRSRRYFRGRRCGLPRLQGRKAGEGGRLQRKRRRPEAAMAEGRGSPLLGSLRLGALGLRLTTSLPQELHGSHAGAGSPAPARLNLQSRARTAAPPSGAPSGPRLRTGSADGGPAPLLPGPGAAPPPPRRPCWLRAGRVRRGPATPGPQLRHLYALVTPWESPPVLHAPQGSLPPTS